MNFGVRPSCVAMRRCGSSLALPETHCLHQERNTTCVSSCLSSYPTVGPGGGFRALATEASSLSCMTGSAGGGASCRFSSITGVSSSLFNMFNGLFSPQRHHALHPPVPALGGSIQNVRFSRFKSMLPTGFNGISPQTQVPRGENTTAMPPSFMEDTTATGPSMSVT